MKKLNNFWLPFDRIEMKVSLFCQLVQVELFDLLLHGLWKAQNYTFLQT